MWYYKEEQITSLEQVPEGAIGFIYRISLLKEDDVYDEPQPSTFYIGKKQLYSSRRTRMSKKEKEATASRKTFKLTVTESNWMQYWSSCKELQEEVKKLGENCFKREIIEFCFNKRDLTFFEVYYQFKYNVLFEDTYNKNILSRFFPNLTKPMY